MAFKATMSLDGKTYRVYHCNYGFHQGIDSRGHPQSAVSGGTIELELESDGDLTIANWMLNPDKIYDGSITIYKRDGEQRMKQIFFKKAFLVSYAESFANFGDNPMTERITISANEVQIENSKGQQEVHKNNWPDKG